MESFACSFTHAIEDFSFTHGSMSKLPRYCQNCALICSFLCVSHREKAPPIPPTLPKPLLITFLVWLDVDFEISGLCYWSMPQTGNQRIVEWIHSKFDRIPTIPPDFIMIVLFPTMSPFWRGGGLVIYAMKLATKLCCE
jgi:hypothetical protein